MGRRQDCRLLLRDVARLVLYPIYLLNMVVVGLGCCLCAPCVCFYCKRKQELWEVSTDEYPYDAMPLGDAAGGGMGGVDREEAGQVAVVAASSSSSSPAPEAALSKGMSLDNMMAPPPVEPTAATTSPRRLAPTPMPAMLRGLAANRVDMAGVRYFNFYLPAAKTDGARLAVDVWLPPGASTAAPVACILHQARYYRSFKLWGPGFYARGGKPLNMINDPYFSKFMSEGLAIVTMDVRGSGASFGQNRGPWMPEETTDSLELLDWIVAQPWSNGRVGLWGISYEGTRALLTGITGHPAVKAICPMYVFLDTYRDVGYIGGLHLLGFIKTWEGITRMLDRNRLPDIFLPWLAWLSIDGVQPVTHELPPPGGEIGAGAPIARPAALLRAAVKEHRDNWSSTKDGEAVEWEDDRSRYNGQSAAELSPYIRIDAWLARLKQQQEAQAPLLPPSPPPPAFFLVSGWFDSTASCAIKLARHLRDAGVPDVKLLVGPWNHAGVQHARFFPDAATGFRRFNAPEEVASWFKARLATAPPGAITAPSSSSDHGPQGGHDGLPPCRYFVMQEERWRTPADGHFPTPGPDGTRALRLVAGKGQGQGGRLVLLPPPSSTSAAGGEGGEEEESGQMTLPVHLHKARVAKGVSRYRAMTHVMQPMEYRFDSSDARIRHLNFTSAPLTEAMEVTGFPRATLWVSSSSVDASLFLYLLCIDARGRAHYVTEGCLRVSGRKLQDEPRPQQSASVLDFPGLPHHTFHRADAQFLEPGGAPVEAQVAMHPTSYRFLPGQALRLAVAGANPQDFLPLRFPDGGASYDLTVHTGPAHPSKLFLPTN